MEFENADQLRVSRSIWVGLQMVNIHTRRYVSRSREVRTIMWRSLIFTDCAIPPEA